MCRVDPTSGSRPVTGEPGEDAVEYSHRAPADEAALERLVGSHSQSALPSTLLLQAVADHVDDTAHPLSVVDPRNPVRQREE